MSACKLFPPEYDTSRHCGEHGLYGPHSQRCDRAPDLAAPDVDSGAERHTASP